MSVTSLRPDALLSLGHQAFEQAGVGMAYLKGDRFVRVNHAFSMLAGYTVEELEDGSVFDFAHADDQFHNRVDFAEMLAADAPLLTIDQRYVRKDGSAVWLSMTMKKIEAIEADRLVVAQDVTARVTAQLQVREERDKLQAALASMTDAVFMCDVDGNLTEYNQAFAKACTSPTDKNDILRTPTRYADYFDLLGLCGNLLSPGAWPVSRALQGEVVTDEVLNVRRRDNGESFIASFNFAPLHTATGEISGCVVVARDVTRRKLAEQQLQAERDKHRAALFSTPDAVFIGNAVGDLIDFNDAFVSFLRYSARDQIFQTLDEYLGIFELATYDGRKLAVEDWPISRAMRGETGSSEPVRFSRKDTQEWWFAACNFAPICSADGSISGAVVIMRDITEAKLAEDALLASREDLERMVDERTRSLAEAKRDADRANDAKTRFLAAASHDLRQPLQAAMAYLGAFKRTAPLSVSASVTNGLTTSLAVMDGLLGTMLDMSRLQSGVIQPRPTQFSLSGLLEEVAKATLPAARKKGIAILTDLQPCQVETDRALMLSVVHNLLSNAVKYTERGFVAVRCRVTDKTATIEIEDSGIGISEADQSTIFVEYVQLANPSRDPNLGVGLGLSLVKTSLDLLGVSLRVRSVVGEGSQFSFDLPCIVVAETAQAMPAEVAKPRIAPLRILLVEDDTAVRESFEILLTTFGYDVVSAATGEEALGCLSGGEAVDVLLTDYRLPDMYGTDVVKAARAMLKTALPAILVTGETRLDSIRDQAILNCEIMSKPVNLTELTDALKKLTPRSQVH